MAINYWTGTGNGNWDDADDWSGGVPEGSTAQAQVQGAQGATLVLSTQHTVQTLSVIGQPNFTFLESAAGSLHVYSALQIAYGGTMVLRGANTNEAGAQVGVAGAHLDVENDQALGTMSLVIGNNGVLTTHGDIHLNNDIKVFALQPAVISAGHGDKLQLTGGVTFDKAATNLTFGETGSDGVVTLGATSVTYTQPDDATQSVSHTVSVAAGTLKLGSATATQLFEGGGYPVYVNTYVKTGGILDLNGYDATIENLQPNLSIPISLNDGRITSTGGLSSLTIDGGGFAGTITGNINLNIEGYFTSYGSMNVGGQITVASSGQLLLYSANIIASGIELDGRLTFVGPIAGAAGVETLSGQLSGTGKLTQQSTSQLVLSHVNSFSGGFDMYSGLTTITNNAALGTGLVSLYGGVLESTANATIANNVTLEGAATIAAAHGRTLTLTGNLGVDQLQFGGTTLTIGQAGDDGVVVANFQSKPGPYGVIVAAGTLRIGPNPGGVAFLSDNYVNTIAAGATLDINGNDVNIDLLSGGGSIVNGAKTVHQLTINGGVFDGLISGKIAVDIGQGATIDHLPHVTLTGANTYTGGTTIDDGYVLALGAGGTGGSIAGAVVDNGRLTVAHSDNITLANSISGSGGFVQRGTGTTILTGTNTFTGGVIVKSGVLQAASAAKLGEGSVTIRGGELAIGSGPDLGNGQVSLFGGELLGLATMSLSGTFEYQGATTIAAAHGTTLTLTGDHFLEAGDVFTFGENANDGTIVLAPNYTEIDEPQYDIRVQSGVLRLSGDEAAIFVQNASNLIVNANGQFDLGGVSTLASVIVGAGRISNSGAAATLQIGSGLFSGQVSGPLTVEAVGAVRLAGAGSFTNLQIDNTAVVTLSAAAAEKVTFSGSGGDLVLAAGSALSGHVAGFGVGDTIDVSGVTFGSGEKLTFKADTGRLTLTNGTQSVTITLDGAYTKTDFGLSSDGHGGTLINTTVVVATTHPESLLGDDPVLHHQHHHEAMDLVI